MTLTIAGTTFEQHHYDERGDVLYLSVADYKGPPATAFSTPEGHNIEYDHSGAVIGMTLVNVRFLLERDGLLTLSLPPEQLAAAELDPCSPRPEPAIDAGGTDGEGSGDHRRIRDYGVSSAGWRARRGCF